MAEDDVVQREAVAHMPHELELVDHARLLGEWRDLLRGDVLPPLDLQLDGVQLKGGMTQGAGAHVPARA